MCIDVSPTNAPLLPTQSYAPIPSSPLLKPSSLVGCKVTPDTQDNDCTINESHHTCSHMIVCPINPTSCPMLPTELQNQPQEVPHNDNNTLANLSPPLQPTPDSSTQTTMTQVNDTTSNATTNLARCTHHPSHKSITQTTQWLCGTVHTWVQAPQQYPSGCHRFHQNASLSKVTLCSSVSDANTSGYLHPLKDRLPHSVPQRHNTLSQAAIPIKTLQDLPLHSSWPPRHFSRWYSHVYDRICQHIVWRNSYDPVACLSLLDFFIATAWTPGDLGDPWWSGIFLKLFSTVK